MRRYLAGIGGVGAASSGLVVLGKDQAPCQVGVIDSEEVENTQF